MFGEIYQHDGNYNYFIMEGKKEKYEGFADRILQENQVPGLLSCQYRHMDGKIYFYYKINSLQSLSQVFERRKVNRKELSHILWEMDRNFREMENYLLKQDKIILLPEYIFVDFDLEKVYFCYYPDYEEVVSYEKLAAFFIDVVDYKDNKAVELAYGFHGQIMEKNSSFSDTVFRLLREKEEQEPIEEIGRSVLEEAKPMPMDEKEKKKESFSKTGRGMERKILPAGIGVLIIEAVLFLGVGIVAVYQGILLMIISIFIFAYVLWMQKKKNTVEEEAYEINLMEEEESLNKEIEYSYGEPVGQTQILSGDFEIETHRLIYDGKEGMNDFDLDVFPFVMGKAENGIDGTISSPMVSRIHCQINYVNQEYTLQDLNSTNGTYLNGCLLMPREQVKIQSGDRIMLANQPFVFR